MVYKEADLLQNAIVDLEVARRAALEVLHQIKRSPIGRRLLNLDEVRLEKLHLVYQGRYKP